MTTRLSGRIAAAVLATGAATAIALGGAAAAQAGPPSSTVLTPGNGVCSASQYASYQVRADGYATNQGAKFKLLRNGVVIQNTPTRVNAWAASCGRPTARSPVRATTASARRTPAPRTPR